MEGAQTFNPIPEFYYDVISRITPGALLLAAYFFQDVNSSLKVQSIALAVLLSYVIGFVLGFVSNTIWAKMFFMRPRLVKWLYRKRKYYTLAEVWKLIRHELSEADKARFIKKNAEFALLENLTLLPVIITVYRPDILQGITEWKVWLCATGCFILLCFCMLSCRIGLCRMVHTMKEGK